MNEYLEKIRDNFKRGNAVIRLIYINVGIFLAVLLVLLIAFLFNSPFSFTNYLALPANTDWLIKQPWTIVTYMFYHEQFFHILFNMLVLYWFGQIFLRYFLSKQVLGVYLLGGLSGAFLYILSYNLFPVFMESVLISRNMGASGGIMAIMVAAAAYAPDQRVNFMFIGPIKLKYIALALFVLDLAMIRISNAGGHITHIGGAIFGYFYGVQMKSGKDMAKGFNRFLDSLFTLFNRKKKMSVSYKKRVAADDYLYNAEKAKEQEKIDDILEKISKSGYDSLTKSEKEILFKMGKNK